MAWYNLGVCLAGQGKTEQARQAYRELAERFGWKIIDASQSVENVHRDLSSAVAKLLFTEARRP